MELHLESVERNKQYLQSVARNNIQKLYSQETYQNFKCNKLINNDSEIVKCNQANRGKEAE